MEFKISKLDRTGTIITASVTFFLIALSVFFILEGPYGWVFAILMLSVIALSYLLSPSKYSIEGGSLIIWKVIGTKIMIPLQEVEGSTTVLDFAKLCISRTFGNGGLFGYYGLFSTREYGALNCQLRRLKDVVLIRTKENTYAISPADIPRFKEYFDSAVHGAGGSIMQLEPVSAEKIRLANPLILIVPAAIFIFTVIMVLVLYPALPDRIAVHFDLQGNPDGWASRTSFMISGLIPATILLVVSTVIFFYVRRTANKAAAPYLIVGLFAAFQFFAGYVSIDTYWVNRYDSHLIPFPHSIIAYGVIVIALLLIYYRTVRARA